MGVSSFGRHERLRLRLCVDDDRPRSRTLAAAIVQSATDPRTQNARGCDWVIGLAAEIVRSETGANGRGHDWSIGRGNERSDRPRWRTQLHAASDRPGGGHRSDWEELAIRLVADTARWRTRLGGRRGCDWSWLAIGQVAEARRWMWRWWGGWAEMVVLWVDTQTQSCEK